MKIAVIGGGVMGLNCALRLAEGGAQVDLFESRICGGGATNASLGALWPASPLARGPLQELHRAALWQFETFIAELASRAGKPIAFQRGGRVEILNSIKAVTRAREEAAAACQYWPKHFSNRPVMEVLEPSALAAEFSMLAPIQFGALHCRATAQVDAKQFVAALISACISAGVQIHENTTINGLDIRDDQVRALQTNAGDIAIEAVLVTAGAWTTKLSDRLAAAAPVTPAKGQGIALGRPATHPACILKAGKTYIVPWEHELLVGSTTEPEAGFDESITPAARSQLATGAASIIPSLADAPILRHWAGLRPDAPHHQPIMGPTSTRGLFVCTGHFKIGIGLAPLVSQLIAQMLLTGQTPAELCPFLPPS